MPLQNNEKGILNMKRTLAFLLTVFLLVSMFAGLSATVNAEEPAALEVYTQTGEAEPVLAKAYTHTELGELKETAEGGYSYVYWKGEDAKYVVATELVTLDALLADAGATFAAGDELKFTCSDGPYPKGDFHYEIMAERGYDTDNKAVPSGFALTYGSTLEEQSSGKLRFVCGATAAELEAKSAAGNRMPSDVVAVTIVKAEEVKPTVVFDDVAKDAYYYDAVYWAVEKEVTKGTGEKTFSPADNCTRAQMVTFLWRAAGSPAQVIEGDPLMVIPFQDVKATDYYCEAVLWAVANGITKGTSDKTFSPDKTVSRAEAVTFLFRLADAAKKSELPIVPAAPSFTDVPADAYYADAVAWACANGITKGVSDKLFAPNDPCLRAQIVTFLFRYFSAK